MYQLSFEGLLEAHAERSAPLYEGPCHASPYAIILAPVVHGSIYCHGQSETQRASAFRVVLPGFNSHVSTPRAQGTTKPGDASEPEALTDPTRSWRMHRPLSSSFLGLPYRILIINHKKGTT